MSRVNYICRSCCLDFVHLRGAGEDVGELSVNCGWGFSAVGFQPRQWNMSVGQPQHEVRRFGHVSKFCAKSRLPHWEMLPKLQHLGSLPTSANSGIAAGSAMGSPAVA